MTTRDITRASKKLSWLLRHGADEAGLSMDAAGWAPVDDVLRLTQLTRDELEVIVETNSKQRLQLDEDLVRACQGHSTSGTPVTAEALEASWEEWAGHESVWHGTSRGALAGIAEQGLLPVKRTHVHLAESLESEVGKRAQVDVALEIDPAGVRARERIFRAPNGVLLVRAVPRAAIVDLRPMTRRSHKEADALRAVMGL